ncbi:MAG: hypothetical protein JWP97_1952 [Labilithrix sp.]|nr:hypothetical protein [Labilithrix sp.]
MRERRGMKDMAGALAGLKAFPAVVAQVRMVVANPMSGANDVARLLEADVGLVTDILRVVNAPASGLTQRCTSVRHAVSLLGMRRVSEVVAGAAALAFVEHTTMPHPALAGHALAVAGVSRLLAPLIGASPDEAFTLGLLHDVGAMLVVQSDDPYYEALIEQTALGEEPSVEDEQAILGFDHGALGAEVLKRWHMPQPLPQVIALHHRWTEAVEVGGAVAAMVAVIRAAEALVAATAELPTPRLADLDVVFGREPAFAYLGFSREEILNLWPALARTSDRAFVLGTEEPEVAPEPEPRVSPVPNLHHAQAPAPNLGLWVAAFAAIASLLIGVLLYTR